LNGRKFDRHIEVKIEVTLRLTVSMSWYWIPLWDLWPDIISWWNVTVWNLRSCFCGGALSDERMDLQFAGNHSMVRVAQNLQPYFTVSSETPPSPNLEGQVPVFISLRTRVAQLYPRALCSLYVVSYDSQGYGGGILTLPLLVIWPSHRSRSYFTTDGKSVNTSRCRAHSGTCDQILLSVRSLFSESCCLVSVGRPLWQEVGSVICHSQSVVIYQCLHQEFKLHVFYSSAIYIQYIYIYIYIYI
jgi:hypothetical protein